MRATLAVLAVLAVALDAPIQGVGRPAPQDTIRVESSVHASALPQGEEGVALLTKGQYTEAIPRLRRAVQLEPGSWKYSLALAEALLSANDNFTGLRFLLKVKPRFQNLREYHYILGLAYYACYQYPEAIREFETLPQNIRNFNRIPFLIGNCYMAMGNLKQAEAYFRQAIRLKPGEATYYVSLAKMLRMEGPSHLDEAVTVLNKALAFKPQDVYARLHLAYCEEEKGNYKDAQALLEQMIRQQPGFQPARLALASVYEHDHEWVKARQQREIASHLKPPEPVKLHNLGPSASTLDPQ